MHWVLDMHSFTLYELPLVVQTSLVISGFSCKFSEKHMMSNTACQLATYQVASGKGFNTTDRPPDQLCCSLSSRWYCSVCCPHLGGCLATFCCRYATCNTQHASAQCIPLDATNPGCKKVAYSTLRLQKTRLFNPMTDETNPVICFTLVRARQHE